MNRIILSLLATMCIHCDDEPDTGTSSGTLVMTVVDEKILYDTVVTVDFNHSDGDYERSISLSGHRSPTGQYYCHVNTDVDSGIIIEAQGCSFSRSVDERETFFDMATGSVSFKGNLIEIDLIGTSRDQPDVVVESHFSALYERY